MSLAFDFLDCLGNQMCSDGAKTLCDLPGNMSRLGRRIWCLLPNHRLGHTRDNPDLTLGGRLESPQMPWLDSKLLERHKGKRNLNLVRRMRLGAKQPKLCSLFEGLVTERGLGLELGSRKALTPAK